MKLDICATTGAGYFDHGSQAAGAVTPPRQTTALEALSASGASANMLPSHSQDWHYPVWYNASWVTTESHCQLSFVYARWRKAGCRNYPSRHDNDQVLLRSVLHVHLVAFNWSRNHFQEDLSGPSCCWTLHGGMGRQMHDAWQDKYRSFHRRIIWNVCKWGEWNPQFL